MNNEKDLLYTKEHERIKIDEQYEPRSVTIAWFRDNHFEIFFNVILLASDYIDEIDKDLINTRLTDEQVGLFYAQLNKGMEEAKTLMRTLPEINWLDQSGNA